MNGSPKRRTISPPGLWTRRVLSISVAVGALIVVVWSGCSDQSPAASTVSGTTKSLVASEVEDGVALSSIPLTSERELSAFEDSAEFIDWKVARTLAYADFRGEDAVRYGWQEATLSERPVVVYDAQSRPELYEFIVHSYDGRALGTITTYAKKETTSLIAYVLPYVRDYEFLLTKGDSFAQISNYYPFEVGVGLPSKSGEEPSLILDPASGEEFEPVPVATPDQVETIVTEWSDEELELKLGVTREEWNSTASERLAYQQQKQAEAADFWKTIEDLSADILTTTDAEIDTVMEAEATKASISFNATRRVFDYTGRREISDEMLSTRWSGWCGPSALAWLYRTQHSPYYNTHYLPLYSESRFQSNYNNTPTNPLRIVTDVDRDGRDDVGFYNFTPCTERSRPWCVPWDNNKKRWDNLRLIRSQSQDGRSDFGLYYSMAYYSISDSKLAQISGGAPSFPGDFAYSLKRVTNGGLRIDRWGWRAIFWSPYKTAVYNHIYYSREPVATVVTAWFSAEPHWVNLVGARKRTITRRWRFLWWRWKTYAHDYFVEVHDNGYLTGDANRPKKYFSGTGSNGNYQPFWVHLGRLADWKMYVYFGLVDRY